MDYLSECCFAQPATELDMSSVPHGGPSGFCGRCWDNCIFFLESELTFDGRKFQDIPTIKELKKESKNG